MKKGLTEYTEISLEVINNDDDDYENIGDVDSEFCRPNLITEHISTCKNCALCCYIILKKYTLYTDAYSVLFTCYKYLLTLPISQVSCERSFSKLKFIKSRLRSTLSGNKLEAFMLMNCEQDITANLSEGQIIDGLANHSKIYGNILKYL